MVMEEEIIETANRSFCVTSKKERIVLIFFFGWYAYRTCMFPIKKSQENGQKGVTCGSKIVI